ncbi:MAG: hypothetical protein IKG84_03130 [Bacteroidales bacterium]|nr:hypothetical protein [Fibrobacter sp.]MBR3387211.1 hypothetical protein [Bacteroidales bacterium]
MKQIVCNTKFKLDPFSDGGSKRSVQIREILDKKGIPYADDVFAPPKDASWIQLVKWSLRAISFIHRHYPKRAIKSLSHYVRLVKYYALRISVVLDKYKHQDVAFLWENTNDRDMLYLLKATGHPIIGMPHNVESLVKSHSIKGLEKEVFNLRQCDAVFAISKEETWLLRLLGFNAYYLPYYPPREARTFLLSVRQKRGRRVPDSVKKYALLGSATNIPTRSGMQTLVDFASTQELSFDLYVAGYGTESLRKVVHPHISFFGTLSNEELETMLIGVDGIIIYQPPTTGALTRIPEMLLAGIPVYVNFDAARNYFNVDGVILYHSFEELLSVLSMSASSSPIGYEGDDSAVELFTNLVSCI